MLEKPATISRVGIIQFFLASVFVVWLLFFPATGNKFAWPIVPPLSAMFIGAGFILRTFMGWHLWREKYWWRIRWLTWGNYTFLGILLVSTFWHVEQMNWHSNIWVAHIWVLAYILEPLMLPQYEPRGEEANAPIPSDEARGQIMNGLKNVLTALFIVSITIGGLLFINPKFMDTRWPWSLDVFDARIMAAWPTAVGVWALTMRYKKDWAEIRMGMQMLIIYASALFVLWLVKFQGFEPARENKEMFGVFTGIFSALMIYYYWRQEKAAPEMAASGAPASD